MDHGGDSFSNKGSKKNISPNDPEDATAMKYIKGPILPLILSPSIPSSTMVEVPVADWTKGNYFPKSLLASQSLENNDGFPSEELIELPTPTGPRLTKTPSVLPLRTKTSSVVKSPSMCTTMFSTNLLSRISQSPVILQSALDASVKSNVNITKVLASNSSPSPLQMDNIENNIFTSKLNEHAGSNLYVKNFREFSDTSDIKSPAKCCFCFGSDHELSALSLSLHTSALPTANKFHKNKCEQAFWSTLITNLGICVLLLAYTLLGSLIFLTIENEDKLAQHRLDQKHQQGVLASTKYISVKRYDGFNYTSESQIVDKNSTTAIPTLSPPSTPSSSTISSSNLEGNTFLKSRSDDSTNAIKRVMLKSPSPFMFSADTYDVRQRTIENIWDITVSLNILYKENWTRLAAFEIFKFQDQLLKRLNDETLLQLSYELSNEDRGAVNKGSPFNPSTDVVLLHTHNKYNRSQEHHEWNFATAFLYSLTILTTIGYGNIAPRTTLGRLVTLIYAIFGIPLTLVYLSSTGGILAKVSREVFSKALCCCLCSNCGYCCYDEKRMAEKERRMKHKRQLKELCTEHQELFYVRSAFTYDVVQTLEKKDSRFRLPTDVRSLPDIESVGLGDVRTSGRGLSMFAPILLCFTMIIIYIVFGALVLYKLENWPMLDGIYFCFMSLSTIGFGDMLPEERNELMEENATTWFCSIYIMSGMTLTAMCFNVLHYEILHRIKIFV